ncbi:TauD/TfdA family dioxygenase [Neisseria canis]|uniref:L-asparagine oxygenase n=1 Tax=Neisseria canis TaxID=493 RepID=A0A448D822_9NEIS|nr:TauD/TfdA family dioxygenase [Neisseria canis]VEF01064.1 L-asparagine oxygenase [Neisseria canis]
MDSNSSLYETALRNVENMKSKCISDKEILKKQNFVVSELEIDKTLPLTPIESGFVKNSEIPITAINLLSYICALELYPVVYQGENEGQLIRHVVPRLGLEKQISSYGSSMDFFPHVDNPDLKLRNEKSSNYLKTPVPDTLSLLCLRQNKEVATSILLLDTVLAEFNVEEKKLLEEPEFTINRPASFTKGSSNNQVPLLVKDNNGLYLSRFDFHNVSTKNPVHSEILEKFKKISLNPDIWISLYLEPGQIVTFDNQRVLHTRNGFQPKFDGYDRWLLRVFGLFTKCAYETLLSPNKCLHHLRTN